MSNTNDHFRKLLDIYPVPISSIVSKYLKIPANKLNDQHSVLCDLFESFVKFTAIIAIKEGLVVDKKIKQRFPNGLGFLKHPALGHWVSIIRAFGMDEYGDEDLFLHKISSWYKSERPSQEIMTSLKALPEVSFSKGQAAVTGIIDCLVTYRNKVWKGHGAVIVNEKTLKDRVFHLEKLLYFILSKATFLTELNLFYSKEVKKINENTYEANAISLSGVHESSVSYLFNSFEPQEVYVAYSSEKSLSRAPISLSPLIEFKVNEKDESLIYFFNDAKKSKLEYLSYYDGSFYYHKEVNKELEEVFNIRLEKGFQTENFYINSLPEEERRKKSSYFLEKALELQKKGNYEGSVIACEDALEWYRTPEAIIIMCKSMLANEEDQDYVLNLLENVFEMDPGNEKALLLKEKIESDNFIDEDPEEYLNYYDVIVPDQIKPYPLIFYAVLLLFAFGLFAAILVLADPPNALTHITFSVLCFVQSIVVFLGLNSAKNNFLDSYFPLLRQQAHMGADKFKKWYDTSYKNIFGHFEKVPDAETRKINIFTRFHWSWKPEMKQEKLFFNFAILFMVVFSFTQINIQSLYDKSLVVAVSRFLQTALMWLFLPPVLRYLIVSTFFIKDYSNKELKPVVSSFHNNGFTALSKIFINSLVIFIIFYVSVLTAYLIVSNDPIYGDVWGVAFGFVVGGFWLIYTPLYIKRSLDVSKSLILSDYNDHINKAFEKFVKNPEKNNLERIQWLKEQELIVSKVSTRLFSLKHWFLYLLSVIVFVTASMGYLIIRFDLTGLLNLF